MELRLVYMTARDEDEARRIGRALVEERLAACANILTSMESFYWWEGKLQQEREAVLIVKTRAALVPGVVSRVQQLHSYSVPCVVSLPILDGNPEFLRWVEAETRVR